MLFKITIEHVDIVDGSHIRARFERYWALRFGGPCFNHVLNSLAKILISLMLLFTNSVDNAQGSNMYILSVP